MNPTPAAHSDAFVHRVVDAAAWLRNPSDTAIVFPKNVDRAIGRTTVDNDVLEIAKGLLAHAFERVPQGGGAVIGGGHNRQERNARVIVRGRLIHMRAARYHVLVNSHSIGPSFVDTLLNLRILFKSR